MTIFSVIIPTRDRPELLAEAIDSVLAQSFADWELIIIDDGGTVELAMPPDDRVRVIRNERSLGPAAARNIGLAAATGKYIAFLDDDDAWLPERLDHALVGHRIGDVVVCGEGRIESPEVGGSFDVVQESRPARLLERTTPHLGRATIAQEVCPPFDPSFRAAEDVDWWFRVLGGHRSLISVSSPDWLWRRHKGPRYGIGQEVRLGAQFQLLDRHGDYLRHHRKARAFRLYRAAILLRWQGNPGEAVALSMRSLRAFPSAKALLEVARGCGHWALGWLKGDRRGNR